MLRIIDRDCFVVILIVTVTVIVTVIVIIIISIVNVVMLSLLSLLSLRFLLPTFTIRLSLSLFTSSYCSCR